MRGTAGAPLLSAVLFLFVAQVATADVILHVDSSYLSYWSYRVLS